jgi:two-component system response regulator DegU
MSQFRDPGNAVKTRVLLLDDNAEFLEVAAQFLNRHVWVVTCSACSGREELPTLVQEFRPQVILVDLDTHGPTGLESIPRLRVMLPGVGIIAMTLSSDSAYSKAALAAGADDLVCKADLTRELLPAIERLAPAMPPPLISNR